MEVPITGPEQDAARREVLDAFAGEFAPAKPGPVTAVPAFVHRPSGHRFRYIPAGRFRMGLSDDEERAARAIFDPVQANLQEMRPVHKVGLRPFLIGERPVLVREADPRATRHREAAAAVTDDEALAICAGLGMSLPTEAQWEYACRAGTTSLFVWGDGLPDEDELAGWLTYDFAGGNGNPNGFGLHGLFVGEWCLDRFTASYSAVPAEDAPRVVRGGGAFFWPWQGEEWVWCMSAMRTPATDLPDGRCGFRLLRTLPA